LFPLFIIFFIGSIAETNRAPFDLAEAESELVSGFMTEHSAVIFVFFFLAEYASIVLMCILTNILFLGGYLFSTSFNYILIFINNIINIQYIIDLFINNKILLILIDNIVLGLKISLMVFIFI
jgi:NADH-ubiquinone oxidoreductase chain 1